MGWVWDGMGGELHLHRISKTSPESSNFKSDLSRRDETRARVHDPTWPATKNQPNTHVHCKLQTQHSSVATTRVTCAQWILATTSSSSSSFYHFSFPLLHPPLHLMTRLSALVTRATKVPLHPPYFMSSQPRVKLWPRKSAPILSVLHCSASLAAQRDQSTLRMSTPTVRHCSIAIFPSTKWKVQAHSIAVHPW